MVISFYLALFYHWLSPPPPPPRSCLFRSAQIIDFHTTSLSGINRYSRFRVFGQLKRFTASPIDWYLPASIGSHTYASILSSNCDTDRTPPHLSDHEKAPSSKDSGRGLLSSGLCPDFLDGSIRGLLRLVKPEI
jgi:hypothetical protein